MKIVVSAAATGAGKTLVARALCAAFSARGRNVQPYKIGPDYIDARLYEAFCGRPAYNVDLWLDGAARLRGHVAATMNGVDVAVFEGMMGLFDGDTEGTTSTAEVARLLDASVVLVLDGWTASQTLAAVALGLRTFSPGLRIAGAVLNRSGGGSHEAAVRTACARVGVPVLAAIPHDPALEVREHRLGLDRTDAVRSETAVAALGRRLAETIDLDALAPPASTMASGPPRAAPPVRARIAVAEDDAFWFTYPETLVALRAAGGAVVPFSPLADAALPAGVDGLWLSGGYPELHAATLAANLTMRASLRSAIDGGLPTYAECGGHMYLAEWLETDDGRFPMVGAIGGGTSMAAPRLTIGYRTAAAATETVLDPRGERLRAYAFHYANPALAAAPPAYVLENGDGEGVARGDLVSSFLHRHFLAGDDAIVRYVDRCVSRH